MTSPDAMCEYSMLFIVCLIEAVALYVCGRLGLLLRPSVTLPYLEVILMMLATAHRDVATDRTDSMTIVSERNTIWKLLTAR